MKTFKLDAEIGYETGKTWYGRQIGPDAVSGFLAGCAPGERVKLEINSSGGLVIPGMAIANSIKNSKAHVVAHVVGLAASMASVIMCACDEIQLEEGSFVMFHNPWGWAEGDADELRKEAEVLDIMKAGIMGFYRAKFPEKSEEEISAMMDADTWMTGDDALRAGLKCVVIPTTMQAAASITRHHFATIPEGARKFLVERTEPEPQPPQEDAAQVAEPVAEGEAPAAEQTAEPEAEAVAEAAPEAPPEAAEPPPAIDWEARYAGLQQAKDRELAALRAEKETISCQLAEKEQALASAQAEASSLAARLGDADAALAEVRKQLADEIEQHRRLAGAALKQPATDAPKGSLAAWTAAMRERRLARSGGSLS